MASTNKLHFFRKVTEEGFQDLIPEWWEREEDIPDNAFPIVCRTVLTGHSGAGIIIDKPPSEFSKIIRCVILNYP